MQDGAAAVIKSQLKHRRENYDRAAQDVLDDAFKRLTSRDPSIGWTSGQWMTERKGGSDVSGTETLASNIGYAPISEGFTKTIDGRELPLGPWIINGFKWFSSATDCGMTLLLARTENGLSCFIAPTRRFRQVNGKPVQELNGLRIQRLKTKLGTRALPTAELELRGMHAYLLGEEGKGVKVIAGVLNITRVHNSVTAVSLLGRGLAIVGAYANLRKVSGGLLRDVPLFRKTIAQHVQAHRMKMLLTFFTVYLLGIVENPGTSSPLPAFESCALTVAQATILLRLLTPIAKALTAKASISGLQESMEALGGVGYLENEENQEINISRLYRDANVLSIWEGTTDIMAIDIVKLVKGHSGRKALDVVDSWIQKVLAGLTISTLKGPLPFLKPYDQWMEGAAVRADMLKSPKNVVSPEMEEAVLWIRLHWTEVKNWILNTTTPELTAHGRKLLSQLGDVFVAVLLALDAARDEDKIATEILRRFVAERSNVISGQASMNSNPGADWREKSKLDAIIAFGNLTGEGTSDSKL
jgi:hypothetical protein